MKLYYWDNVLTDYTDGMMFAIANSLEEAKEALLADCRYIPKEDLEKKPKIVELDKPFGASCWGGG